jgi:hypothetical protein
MPAAPVGTIVSHHTGQLLGSLLSDVKQARATLRRTRSGGRPEAVRSAQVDFVAALTTYTETLTRLALPVPYVLRDELRIHGDTLRSARPGRPR